MDDLYINKIMRKNDLKTKTILLSKFVVPNPHTHTPMRKFNIWFAFIKYNMYFIRLYNFTYNSG